MTKLLELPVIMLTYRMTWGSFKTSIRLFRRRSNPNLGLKCICITETCVSIRNQGTVANSTFYKGKSRSFVRTFFKDLEVHTSDVSRESVVMVLKPVM